MTIQEIKQAIRAKDLELRQLQKQSDATNDLTELRSIGDKMGKINSERYQLEDQLYEAEQGQNSDEWRGEARPHDLEKRSPGPIGANQIIATYGVGTGQNTLTNEKRGNDNMKTDIYGTQEYRSAFFKTLLGHKLDAEESRVYTDAMNQMSAERRDNVFSTTTNSAAVIPTATLNEVISKARTQGGLMAVCRYFNIPSNLTVPVGTPANKADWHVQGAAVDSEKPSVGSVNFSANEIIKVFSISAAAKTMSINAFESYLTTELTSCVMATIEDSIVNGAGTTGQGTGILPGITWTAANTYTYTSAPYYDDFVAAIAKLKRGYGAGAVWAMNNSMYYKYLYGMADANGNPVLVQDPRTDAINYFLGKPVVLDDYLADDVILYGNFAYMGYNLPEGILLEVSRDSSFKSGLVDYRALAIADTKPIIDEAFIKMVASA